MLCTEGCGRWAQWRVSTPELNDKNELVRMKTIGFVCTVDKDNLLQAPKELDLRFSFAGVIPDGFGTA